MLQVSRSNGNARETMKPPGIKRSTLFRRRDTCSNSRRLDSRITVSNIDSKPVHASEHITNGTSRRQVKQYDCEKSVRTRNISEGYCSQKAAKFSTQINDNVAIVNAEAARIRVNSESKIRSKSEQVLEDFESIRCWEWKVDVGPKRSAAMSKLKRLRQERTDVFTDLRSSLEKMLNAVRQMKNQQSR